MKKIVLFLLFLLVAAPVFAFQRGGMQLEDEGTAKAPSNTFNFTGTGITCDTTGGKWVCSVPGSGGAGDSVTVDGAATTDPNFQDSADIDFTYSAPNVSAALPAAIDFGGKTSLEIPNGAAPTVDVFGELAGDNDFWGASRGAIRFYDGTSAVGLVGILSTDTCAPGQVPTFQTGGTWTCETSTSFTETSLAGLSLSQTLWDQVSATRTLTAGLSGATDPVITFGDASIDVTTGTLKQGGTAVVLQSRTLTGASGIAAIGDLSANRTIALLYSDTLAGDPAMNAEECRFSTDGTGGGLVCEGTTADAFEGLVVFPFTGSDKTITFPDATGTVALTSDLAFSSLSGTASDAQVPNLNTLSTGLTVSRCVETDGTGLLTVAAGACGSGAGDLTEVQGTANEVSVATGTGPVPVVSIATTFDISGKTSTKPVKTGTSAPATCGVGELFFDTDATAGLNAFGCTSTNTWTLLGDGGAGGGDSISVDAGAVVDPNFDDGGDINFTNTSNTITATVKADSVALTADTTGNYVASVGTGGGLTGGAAGSEGATLSLGLLFSETLAGNPALNAEDCHFSNDGAGGGLICEGTTADAFEGLVVFPFTASDKTITFFDATDTVVGRGTTDILTNKTLAAANNVIDADTAVALAANGANCSAGQFPLGVDASGASETCTALPTTIAGTTNEISASASTGAITLSLPATVDLGGKTSFEVPNGAAPTVDAFGEIAGDNDFWGASRGAPVFFDGTSTVGLVGVLSTDTCANGEVVKFNTGGTFTCEADATGSGFGETSLSTLVNNQTIFDSANASRTITFGLSGATDPVFTFADNSVDVSSGVLKRGGNNVLTTSSIEAMTNKTYDCEATGNVCKFPVRVNLKGAGCNGTQAATAWNLPTSSAPTAVCFGTTTTTGALEFADGSTTGATISFLSGGDWDTSAALDIAFHYTGDTSSTNNIRWQVSVACVGDDEDMIAPSYNTASASNSAGPTTAGQRKVVQFSGVTKTNCAAAEQLYVKAERVGGDAGDTYTGIARLVEVVVLYRRSI